jgi:hypothetical protein
MYEREKCTRRTAQYDAAIRGGGLFWAPVWLWADPPPPAWESREKKGRKDGMEMGIPGRGIYASAGTTEMHGRGEKRERAKEGRGARSVEQDTININI